MSIVNLERRTVPDIHLDWRTERNFERLVNADLRDHAGTGPQYLYLRAKENRVRWLQVLTQIRASILSQNTHDNAAIKAHPDRPNGGLTPRAYLEAKKAVDERKRSRERAMRSVNERIGEVRRMIGADPVSHWTAGIIVQHLVDVDLLLRGGDVVDAHGKVAALIRMLDDLDSEPQVIA